jgi:hypothetical protein
MDETMVGIGSEPPRGRHRAGGFRGRVTRAVGAAAAVLTTMLASAAVSYAILHPVTPSAPRHPTPGANGVPDPADLRSLLVPVPAGGHLVAPDRLFTLATVPTDLVWQSLHHRGFVRGAVRRWIQPNRTEVAVVLFQFQTPDQARVFTDAVHQALQYWPGCGGYYTTGSDIHGRIYGCEAIGSDEPPGCRATLYGDEFSGYLVVRQPTGVDPRSVSDLVAAQGDLLE